MLREENRRKASTSFGLVETLQKLENNAKKILEPKLMQSKKLLSTKESEDSSNREKPAIQFDKPAKEEEETRQRKQHISSDQ